MTSIGISQQLGSNSSTSRSAILNDDKMDMLTLLKMPIDVHTEFIYITVQLIPIIFKTKPGTEWYMSCVVERVCVRT